MPPFSVPLIPHPALQPRRYIDIVRRINALRGAMAALSDDELAAKTGELRHRIEAAGLGGPDPGSSPAEILSGGGSSGSDAWASGSSRERRRAQAAEWRKRGLLGGLPEDVVIEGFAVVREAAHRVLGMRHYDVQLVRELGVHLIELPALCRNKEGGGACCVWCWACVQLARLEGRGPSTAAVAGLWWGMFPGCRCVLQCVPAHGCVCGARRGKLLVAGLPQPLPTCHFNLPAGLPVNNLCSWAA